MPPRREPPAAGPPAGVRAEETRKKKGESGWMAVANKLVCYLWRDP